jgi:ketosteroid isomerase-like protein
MNGPGDIAVAYGIAWGAHDADAVAALHTEDSEFQVHGLGEPATGRAAVRALAAEFLGLVPDLRFDIKRAYFGPDHMVIEYDMSGTAGAAHFVCDAVDVMAIADGLVARKETYLDLVALQRQIGALPLMNISPVP